MVCTSIRLRASLGGSHRPFFKRRVLFVCGVLCILSASLYPRALLLCLFVLFVCVFFCGLFRSFWGMCCVYSLLSHRLLFVVVCLLVVWCFSVCVAWVSILRYSLLLVASLLCFMLIAFALFGGCLS